ncbi:MAG: phosphatase PAP2 family protein, partial [Burkholderiales bacterium]
MSRIDATLRRLQRWDESACLRLNQGLRYTLLQRTLQAVSWLGNGVLWYALMAALLVRYRGDALQPVLHMIFVGAVGAGAYALVKRGTSRPRPYQTLREIAAGAHALDVFSFPSGHTLHAVAFTLVACAYYPGLLPLLGAFTLLTAVSRVMLGLHYPSDVLA